MARGTPRWLILATLLAFLLLAACGGDEEAEPAEGERDTPTATTQATKEAADGESAISIASPEELNSFRYSISMHLEMPALEDELLEGFAALFSDVEIEGAFVAPDRMEMQMTLPREGSEMGAIVIGDRAWSRFEDEWTESPEGAFEVDLFSPDDLMGSILDEEALAGVEADREEMNGVDALHYTISEGDLGRLMETLGAEVEGEELPEEMTVDLWISEEGGYPIRITVDAAGEDEEGRQVSMELEMNITDINDPDIEIEPPEM